MVFVWLKINKFVIIYLIIVNTLEMYGCMYTVANAWYACSMFETIYKQVLL